MLAREASILRQELTVFMVIREVIGTIILLLIEKLTQFEIAMDAMNSLQYVIAIPL